MKLFNIRAFRLKQQGDTIVEVLISIAIAGLVIAGSYALASRSLRQGITASERTEALKIAEGQIEALKFRHQKSSAGEWNPNFITSSSINNSCLDPAGTDPSISSTWRPVKNGAPDPAKNFPTILEKKTDSGFYDPVCVVSEKYFINITIPKNPIPIDSPTYLFTVRWGAIGTGQNQTQLYYRF